jgi:hypothetical protein
MPARRSDDSHFLMSEGKMAPLAHAHPQANADSSKISIGMLTVKPSIGRGWLQTCQLSRPKGIGCLWPVSTPPKPVTL